MLTALPLSHLTSCTPTKFNLYLANSLAVATSEPALYWLLTFQVPSDALFHCLGRTKGLRLCLWIFHNKIHFYGEELLEPCPTHKLEDHLLSAVRGCLFDILAATLHIGGRSSIHNMKMQHAVVTGTHDSHGKLHTSIIKAGQLILSRWQIEHVFIWKTNSVSEYVKLTNVFLYLQSSLSIDSGTKLCDVWLLNCCSVERGNFLLQSIQTASGNHPASYSQDTWGFFHWWWNNHGMKLTTDRHVMLGIKMCGAVSPVPMFLAPVHRDNCTFYFYWSDTHLSFFANWWGSVREQTVIMTELTNCELCL